MRVLGQLEPKLEKLDLKIVFVDGKKYPDLEDFKFDLLPAILTILPVFSEPENYQKIKEFFRNFEIFGIGVFFSVNKNTF